MGFISRLFSAGARRSRSLKAEAGRCAAAAQAMRGRPDRWFSSRMNELREQIASLPEEKRNAALDAAQTETFAMAAEAGRRTLGLEMRIVQFMGACAMHKGWIAEMKTGEGKTLAAVPAAALNALSGLPVHISTANGYLASRDAAWTGPAYAFLGLTVGAVSAGMEDPERREIYERDVVYSTNSEFGFDYLRDNMKISPDDQVLRGLGCIIVDEADSALIDEARTPLIISGPAMGTEALWRRTAEAVSRLEEGDWTLDEKMRSAFLTDSGVEKLEKDFGVDSLFDPANALLQHHAAMSLKAMLAYRRDRDYVVKNGEILVVDELTGRTLPGRRWSDGLHQAIEAKEGVAVQPESRTEASISFQSFFRLYRKLAGMTGTAETSAVELKRTYGLEVASIPPHMPLKRIDLPDLVYMTAREKYAAVTEEVKCLHMMGRPVLVGTSSVEVSEALSRRFAREGLEHFVLNAKEHAREAEIAALAGQHGRITVATNMAGRGVDIVLDAEARAAGGLAIVGTERTESRRADDQLRGRAGRQGDPGSSQFFVSLEDPLPRIFGSDKLKGMLAMLGAGDGRPIGSRAVARAVENAQRKIEELHAETRKMLTDYDAALNSQREVVYAMRRNFIDPDLAEQAVRDEIAPFIEELLAGQPDPAEAKQILLDVFGGDEADLEGIPMTSEGVSGFCLGRYGAQKALAGDGAAEAFGRIFLEELDVGWRRQLRDMAALRDGIGLRAYSRLDPKLEYGRAAWDMFQCYLSRTRRNALRAICRLEITRGGSEEADWITEE